MSRRCTVGMNLPQLPVHQAQPPTGEKVRASLSPGVYTTKHAKAVSKRIEKFKNQLLYSETPISQVNRNVVYCNTILTPCRE